MAVIAVVALRLPADAGADAQHAYIGPGAGIALVGSFFAVFSAFLSAVFFVVTWPVRMVWRALRSGRALARAKAKRVVILGLDGLEPELTEQFLDEGLLPNLARLRESGDYRRLGTTCPPLSPVAWSSFTTGTNPGKHNIFDFISRNPADYRPEQSSVRIRPGRRRLTFGRWELPLSGPRITSLRKSKPFWGVLGEAGIFSAILRVPITFPPDRFNGVQLSAMCVPDLRGTHGMFSFFTESEAEGATSDGEVGGDVIRIERDGDTVRAFLRGPGHPFRRDHAELKLPFRVVRRRDGTFVLEIGGERVPLEPHRSTGWIRVTFRTMAGTVRVRGLCRFLLHRFEPPFEMYCTPVHIDPVKPAMPISHPRRYAAYLGLSQGDYATLGLAEDTWALSEGRIDEDAFLAQSYDIHAERERMYMDAIEKVRRGLVACVFDAPDRIQHMFWRFIDDGHPAVVNGQRERYRHVIRDMYQNMDALVGRTLDAIDDDTVLFVMSDHGFKPFRRGVDLNAWLRDNGYLTLREGATLPTGAYLADVDWSRTRAYALGLAGIFLNVVGREGEGTVPPAEAAALRREIADKLTGLRDEARAEDAGGAGGVGGAGAVAIHEAMPRETVYSGPYVDSAADIIVGYAVGYRVSWDAVIGKCGGPVFSDNTKAWSGDHCIHPALVPGVLFCNRPLADGPANIIDLAPTTLEVFGVSRPAYMDGTSLLPDDGE